MKQLVKYIITGAIGAAILLSLSSCNDLLDRDPQGEGTIEEASIQSRVFSLYAQTRSYNVTAGIPAFAVHMMRSEDSEKGSQDGDGNDIAAMFDNFEYVSSNGTIGAYWKSNFQMIVLVGQILRDIDKMPEADKTKDILQSKAEAHFFRAFAYFNLVRAFGEVPLIDFAVENPGDANVAKSSVDAIYALIDADLAYATENLPVKWGTEFEGRLSWGAARAMHARTYMMRNDWAKMHAAATDVIGSGLYNLDITSDKAFMDEGEWSGESVFELGCSSTTALPESLRIGSQFAQVQGVRGSGQWDLGWGWHMATKEVGEAFEAGDPRKDATLLYFRKNATDPITAENTNKPWGESPVSKGMGAYFNKKAYTDPEMRKQYTRFGFWVNIRIIRYSDVLLMGAEAANELGRSGEALGYLEEVRARARRSADAGVDQSTLLPKVTTAGQGELRDAIKHERRVELALEWDRFYDLVRWGDAQKVLHAAGKTKYQDKHRYLPIPQVEIDKSNGVLKQNSDYAN